MQLKLVDHKKAPNSKNSEIDFGNRLNNRSQKWFTHKIHSGELMPVEVKLPIKEVDLQKTTDILTEALGDITKGLSEALSRNDFTFVIRNNTEWTLKRTGAVNDSSSWPFEDIEPKMIDIKLMSAKSFSFAAKYALPHREIVIGASYPLIGSKKIAMEWSADAKKTWDNMDDGMDKSADSNRAYITEANGKLIWIFEINE